VPINADQLVTVNSLHGILIVIFRTKPARILIELQLSIREWVSSTELNIDLIQVNLLVIFGQLILAQLTSAYNIKLAIKIEICL